MSRVVATTAAGAAALRRACCRPLPTRAFVTAAGEASMRSGCLPNRRTYATSTADTASHAAARARLRSGFGSFHSPSVEDLVRVPPADWPQSVLAKDAPGPPDLCMCMPGTKGMRQQFCIDFGRWTFLNHGAFGATLRPVMAHAEAWRMKQEEQPLRFFDRLLLPELARALHRMAAFMGAHPTDIVFVPNATTALNTVLQSLGRSLTSQDTVLTLDIAYGSVKKMVQHVVQRSGAHHVQLQVPLPLSSHTDILDVVHEYLMQCRADALPAVAVFDHITSNTALQLPLAELAELITTHSPSTRVVVDGAHGLVQADVDMAQLQAAGVRYYAANCHKWMSSAKSVGVLWAASDEDKEALQPLIVSHGHGHGFTSDYVWDGCRDYAPALSLCTALDFWQGHGPARMRDYSRDLLTDAASLLREAWGTGGIVDSDSDSSAHRSLHACMALVELPPNKDYSASALQATRKVTECDREQDSTSHTASTPAFESEADTGVRVQDWLYSNGVEVPVKTINNRMYVRISAHVYNCFEDYRPLADIVRALPEDTATPSKA